MVWIWSTVLSRLGSVFAAVFDWTDSFPLSSLKPYFSSKVPRQEGFYCRNYFNVYVLGTRMKMVNWGAGLFLLVLFSVHLSFRCMLYPHFFLDAHTCACAIMYIGTSLLTPDLQKLKSSLMAQPYPMSAVVGGAKSSPSVSSSSASSSSAFRDMANSACSYTIH